MQTLRRCPNLLVSLQHGTTLGVDRSVVEVAQRWVVEEAGFKQSDARELQRALLASFAGLVPVNDERLQLVSASFTELAAGVALANASHVFTMLLSGRPKLAEAYYHSGNVDTTSDLILSQTAWIAALAQLAPDATKLRATTFSLHLHLNLYRRGSLLELAACRLLFSKLPHLPQRLIICLGTEDKEPGLARGLASSLLTQRELHTSVKSIKVHMVTLEQYLRMCGTIPRRRWTQVVRQTIRDIRTTALLGIYRSQTSPLRLLPPSVARLIMERIRLEPCSLTIVEPRESESEEQSGGWSD